MSTEQITLSPDMIEVAIRRHPMQTDRFVAGVIFDGREVSLDCNHLHHTERAAAKCLDKVADREHIWRGAPTTVIDSPGIPYSIFEQTSVEARPEHVVMGDHVIPARDVLVSRRFTYLDDRRVQHA